MKATPDPIESVTNETFNLVWAYLDWAIKAGRFLFSGDPIEQFRQIQREYDDAGQAIQCLNDWMVNHLKPETRQQVFSDIRKAQFEAAKGAVQINISADTRDMLKDRRITLYGKDKGSMEILIRHLLEVEPRSLPSQAFRMLETYQKRKNLRSPTEAVMELLDMAERGSSSTINNKKIQPLQEEMEQLLEELKA